MPMIEINLLPKQFAKRAGRISFGKHGIYAAISVAGVLLMFASITAWQLYKMDELEGQMEIARARTLQLQKDIKLVDALTDIKEKLTDRLGAVERLDRHRSTWVKILEDVSKNVPDFVWLSKFTELDEPPPPANDTTVEAQPAPEPQRPMVKPTEIEGFTFTLNALAAFMIKMMRSNYFDEIDLALTEEKGFDRHTVYNFKISCNVHYLSDEELDEALTQESSAANTKIN